LDIFSVIEEMALQLLYTILQVKKKCTIAWFQRRTVRGMQPVQKGENPQKKGAKSPVLSPQKDVGKMEEI